jgi:hypothetical protein
VRSLGPALAAEHLPLVRVQETEGDDSQQGGGVMSKSKHSPAPWRSVLSDSIAGDDTDATWIQCDDHSIAELICPADEMEANANLIAAAPDLLAALEECVRELVSWEMDPETDTAAEPLNMARAALAKAKGEQ